MNHENDRFRYDYVQHEDESYCEARLREERHMQDILSRRKIEVDDLLRLESTRAQGPRHAATIFGIGYAGYGNGWTEGKPRILYPKERKRMRRHLREVMFSKQTLRDTAVRDETLVPIRFDIDYDRFKLRDTLTWNLHDSAVPLDIFAEHVCEDYGLPINGFAKDIERSLRAQLADFHPHKYPDRSPLNSQGSASSEDQGYTLLHDDDLRIPIKFDITIGSYNLSDQIEWDINNANNDPERYAELFCLEFGLTSEFCTAIAHTIREQCQMYTKSLFLAGYSFDSKGIHDADLRQLIMPPVFSSIRPKHQMDQFAPVLSNLEVDQLERIERDREREGRRNRRQTRGKRGVILPDLTDLPKTYRTRYYSTVLQIEEPASSTKVVPIEETNPSYDPDDSEEEEHEDDFAFEEEEETTRHERRTRAARVSRSHVTLPAVSRSNNDTRVINPHFHGLSENLISKQSSEYNEPLKMGRIEDRRLQGSQNRYNRAADVKDQLDNDQGYTNNGYDLGQLPSEQAPSSPTPSCLVVLKISKQKLAMSMKPAYRYGQGPGFQTQQASHIPHPYRYA